MKLIDLLEGVILPGDPVPDVVVTGVSLDSRKVVPGDLFLATNDRYLDEAVQRGARAILYGGDTPLPALFHGVPVLSATLLPDKVAQVAARFQGYPAHHMQLVGVTGTSGKTSCTQFLAEALRHLALPCGVIGTLGTGWDGTLQSSPLTTPDAVTLHATLAQFLAHGVPRATMEVSSHALHQGRVAGIPFAVGIFTNLSRDHLDYHPDMAAYGAEKKKLFAQSAVSVINANDPFGRSCLPLLRPYVACGTDQVAGPFLQTLPASSRVMASHVQLIEGRFFADIESPWGAGRLCLALPGYFNVENALLVLAALCLLEVPFDQALASLATLTPVPGRMQQFGGSGLPQVIVDYAHKPDALQKVLATLRAQCTGKLYCVFGCGGGRDTGKRVLMGEVAGRYADHVIVTDDNPRDEAPEKIVADILPGVPAATPVTVEHDRYQAIALALRLAGPDDVVLVAGKGAETMQYRLGQAVPFSDVQVVETLLQSS